MVRAMLIKHIREHYDFREEADGEAAANAGFNGTPSFLLGRSGGTLEKVAELSGADLTEPSAYFEPAIEKLLKK